MGLLCEVQYTFAKRSSMFLLLPLCFAVFSCHGANGFGSKAIPGSQERRLAVGFAGLLGEMQDVVLKRWLPCSVHHRPRDNRGIDSRLCGTGTHFIPAWRVSMAGPS